MGKTMNYRYFSDDIYNRGFGVTAVNHLLPQGIPRLRGLFVWK